MTDLERPRGAWPSTRGPRRGSGGHRTVVSRLANWGIAALGESWLDGVLLLSLGLLAVALRLPEYQHVPAFTDERNDTLLALHIVRGEVLPLTNDPSYIGAFWNYVLAASFWVGGESLLVPRTVVLVLGVVGVLAAYPLGYAWGGRSAALLTALLVATSAGHIAFTSRVAWSHSTTPLFATIGSWALVGMIGRDGRVSPGRAILAGLAWGLAFQSHPTVLALLPGAALYVILCRRRLLTSRWLYVAGLVYLLVNLNLLVYNVRSGFDSIDQGIDQSGEYAEGEPLSGRLYMQRAGLLLLGLFQSLGGAVDLDASPAELLLDPGLWPIALLAAAGVVWQWRRGNPLPGLLVVSALVILPLINGKYNLVPNGRYLAPLLPLLYGAVAALLVDAFQLVPRVMADSARSLRITSAIVRGSLPVVAAYAIVHPLLYLRAYHAEVPVVGWTNEPVFATLAVIEAHPDPDVPVILDRALNVHIAGWGNGTPRDAFELGLTVSRTRYRVADVRDDDNTSKLLAGSSRCRDQLVVLAQRDAAQNGEVVSRLGLQPAWWSYPWSNRWEAVYPVYLLPRAPEAPSAC